MKFVIFGEPQTGKTAFFNLLTGLGEKKKHIAVVKVPDPRLDSVAEVEKSAKKTPISLSFVDPPAREQINEMRGGDALLHVIKSDDPLKEIKKKEEEFLISDLEIISGKVERLEKEYSKRKDKELEKEIDFLRKVKETLEKGICLRQEYEEESYLKGLGLLSLKPIIHVINCDFENVEKWDRVAKSISGKMKGAFVIDVKTEQELLESPEKERKELMEEFGIREVRAKKFLEKAFKVLELIVFYTPGEKETRALEIRKGTTALEAAGKIHTDIAKGFIRAEVCNWEEFVDSGGWTGVKQSGKLRLEGKDYVVQDGDVIYFRFNR